MTIPVPVVQIWNEDGSTPLGLLRAVRSLVISDVLSDIGSMTVAVPRNVQGADLLMVDADRQIRVRMTDCPDMWFLADDKQTTFVSDDPDSEDVQLTMRSLAGVVDEAKVIPSAGVGSTPAAWAFTDATPGKIVADLFDAAQGLGFLQGLTLSGGDTADASSTSWPETYTATYRAGESLLDVLRGLAGLGLLEWRMNGRALELHRPGGDLDRTLTTPFRPRRDVESAPYQGTSRNIATDVLVEGKDGATTLRAQSLPGRRRRMAYVSQSSAPADAIDQVGDLYLAAHAAPDVQLSHGLTDGDSTPVPWRDYRPGDRVPTLAGGQGVSVERVAQIALTYEAESGASVALELGSIQASAEEVFDAKLRKLLPGDQA